MLKKTVLISLTIFLMLTGKIFAQERFPYRSIDEDDTWVALANFTIFYHLYIKDDVKPLTIDEINKLNRQKIPFFDRFAIDNYSPVSAKWSDRLLISSVAVSTLSSFILPVFNADSKKDYLWQFLNLAKLTFTVNYLCISFTDFSKITFTRPRPYVYRSDTTFDKFTQDARFSFFSGHTSIAAANCFLAARLCYDYYPEANWKKFVLIGAAIFPACVGYLRVDAGKHFLSDVVTGYAVGALCGWFYPKTLKINQNKTKISLFPFQSGRYNGLAAQITF